MSEALTLAIYLIICRETGETVRFPGNDFMYDCPDDNSYAASLAKMSVWASTEEHTANEAFNHVNGDTFVWRYFLPQIGAYFGLGVRLAWPQVARHEKDANAPRCPSISSRTST